MKFFTILAFFLPFLLSAQPNVELDQYGKYQEVVVLKKENLYNETIEWVGKQYKNPDEVIKSRTENEFVRIDGVSPEENGIPGYYYTIEIDFKSGKYRVTFQLGELFINYMNLPNWTYSSYFKKDGTIKKLNMKKVERLTGDIKELILSHYNYLTTQEKRDDW